MTPAFRLLCACCSWPDDDARRDAILASANAIEDWGEIPQLADRHRVEPLVAHGLAAAGLPIPAALQRAVAHHRALGLRDIAETLRIAAALDDAGIVHRFLKGAALGARVYGNPLLKRSWDIDVLVLPPDAVTAATVLALLGYTPHMPPRPLDQEEFERWSVVSKEAEFRLPNGTTVELHWGVSDHPMLLPTLNAASAGQRETLLGHHSVATFDDGENLAYLAVHGSAHAWSRLKWIADFNALLARVEDRSKAIERAKSFAAGRALDAALDLRKILFNPGFADRTAAGLVRYSLSALASGENSLAIGHFASRSRLRMGSGAKHLFYEVALRARGTLDRIDFPLSHRWRWLYPALRLPLWARRYVRARRDAKKSGVA